MDVRGSRDAWPAWVPPGPHTHPVAPWLECRATPSARVAGHGTRQPGVPGFVHRRPSVALGSALLGILAVGALTLLRPVTGGPTVSTPFLSYSLPAGWTADPASATAPPASALVGAVRGPGYDCAGEHYLRGFAAATLLPTDAAPGSGAADRAERLARWFAAEAYPRNDATVAPPRPVPVAGPRGAVDGTVIELTARSAAHDGCPPVDGTVLVLAAPVGGGAALLLVAGDTDGGPADPAPPERAALDAVLASVRLVPD
jgi:hypothetical protein